MDLSGYSLETIFLASAIVFLLAIELGRAFGARESKDSNISTLEAAVLGLLALMISFTFSMALNRFEARREALLAEANAIGTTALRARLLPAPQRDASLALLRDYVQIRLEVVQGEGAPAALRRSSEIQEALWREARSLAVKDNAMVPTGLFIQTLNETFDDQQKRLTILANRVPNIVFLALYGVAAVAFVFTGYSGAPGKLSWRPPAYVMATLVAGVILLIQDLDRPTAGFIAVSQQPMIDTAKAIDGYLSAAKAESSPRK
ncbi:MAG TPA: hypothetical protein VK446_09075 [Methylocystis sp.]|nr:hypothetical protein [Methylocystis sp.]